MPKICPKCRRDEQTGLKFVCYGFFFRTSDSRRIQRFQCLSCRATCSNATFSFWFRQKKRLKNAALRKELASCTSMRRAARNLLLNRKTVARKLVALGFYAEAQLQRENKHKPKSIVIEFDDLETFEHTKCKPLSITLAVEFKTRRVLGLEVSSMPAKGLLAKISRKKYGYRKDDRKRGRSLLFNQIKDFVAENALIKSDSNPHYGPCVKEHFPKAKHRTYISREGCITGQGELKKVKYDPLFSLNHTCASFRDDVKRLVRRTWCTTKRPDRLRSHLMLYAHYHNENLKQNIT